MTLDNRLVEALRGMIFPSPPQSDHLHAGVFSKVLVRPVVLVYPYDLVFASREVLRYLSAFHEYVLICIKGSSSVDNYSLHL